LHYQIVKQVSHTRSLSAIAHPIW